MGGRHQPLNGADSAPYDREYLDDMLAEGKRECGECGVHYPEDELSPLVDHYGEWYRCQSCALRDFQAYNEALVS